MKILYHHRTRSKDGQYVHIEEMIAALRSLGHEVVVVGPASAEREEFGADGGFVARLKKILPKAVYELAEFAYNLHAYKRLSQAIRAHRPDCIYERYNLFLPAGVWAKRRFKLPLLLEVKAPIYAERTKFDGLALDALARWSERYTWRGADAVLPVTRVLGGLIGNEGVASTRIHVIPNGINPEQFAGHVDGSEIRKRLKLERKLVLGFTGFIREWHGLDRIIDLVAGDTPEAHRHLVVVGDGPARSALEQQVKRLGIADRVTFTGIVPRSEIPSFVAAFDIALQPAVVGYASPLKLFEYLALGRAVIAPDQGNIRRYSKMEKCSAVRPR
jgi:glycosyltransferase involved in cell wall biosynthesis